MIKRPVSYLLMVFSILIILLAELNYIYVIDEVVTNGRAYGLTIGESKLETYKYIVEHELSNSYSHIQGGEAPNYLAASSIKQSSYYQLKQYDKWYIIIGNSISYNNRLEIVFNESGIISLSRKRQISNVSIYFTKIEQLFKKISHFIKNIVSDYTS